MHGSFHIAAHYEMANNRRTHGSIHAIIFFSFHHLNTYLLAVGLIIEESLASVVPETVVESHHERFETEIALQHHHKSSGVERGELRVEVHKNQVVDAGVGNAGDAVVEGANPLHIATMQHILRVVAKGYHGSFQASFGSFAF